MTGKERISRFLERAKDCERAAQQARAAPRLQKLYLEMAAQWHERTRQSWPQEDAQQQGHDLPCDDETQRRSIHVDYLEWLRKGSQMHVASPTEDGFTIEPANDTPECKARFHEIVEHAIANASSAHYAILPHAAWGKWDDAAIIIRRASDGELSARNHVSTAHQKPR